MGDVLTGKVKWFNASKGFGFLIPDAGGKDIFIHHSNIKMQGYRTLNEGQPVTYSMGDGKGGPQAIDVTPTEQK